MIITIGRSINTVLILDMDTMNIDSMLFTCVIVVFNNLTHSFKFLAFMEIERDH